MFTDGLTLNSTHFKHYQKNKLGLLYAIILVVSISMVVMFVRYNQLNLTNFFASDSQNNQVIINGNLSEVTDVSTNNQGIYFVEQGIFIDKLGTIPFDLLTDTKNSQLSVGELMRKNEGKIKMVIFLTLYIKSFYFIIVGIVSFLLVSFSLKKVIASTIASRGVSASLMTIPSFIFLGLNSIHVRLSLALFMFVMSYVLLTWYMSRVISTDNRNDESL